MIAGLSSISPSSERMLGSRASLVTGVLCLPCARSLKYIDLRLIDRGFLYRSSLELEFSAIACYIGTGPGAGVRGSSCDGKDPPSVENDAGDESKDESAPSGGTVSRTNHYSSSYPLPVILVSQAAFKAFHTDFYGYPKHLLLTTTPQTRWVSLGRAHLVTSNPGQQSLYYREWTEPKPKLLVGTQCNSVNSRPVISMRSASGIVISPDIPGNSAPPGAVSRFQGPFQLECFARVEPCLVCPQDPNLGKDV